MRKLQANNGSEPSSSQKEAAEAAQDIASRIPSISKLPENDKQVLVREITQTIQVSGPIPPPKILAGYEEILPGSANRILTMAESDQIHAHQIQKEVMQLERQAQDREDNIVKCDYKSRMSGQRFAFLSIGLFVGLAAFFAWLGHPAYAVVFGGAVMGAIATAFINGQKKPVETLNKDNQINKNRRNSKK